MTKSNHLGKLRKHCRLGVAACVFGSTILVGVGVLGTSPASASEQWFQVNGSMTEVAVGAYGNAWAIGTVPVAGGYQISQWNMVHLMWDLEPGGAVEIAVGPNDTPWVVNSNHQVLQWNGSGWNLEPGSATDVAVGPDGSVWAIGTVPVAGGYQILQWNGSGWDLEPGGAVEIAVGPKDTPWVVNSNGDVFQFNGSDKWNLEEGKTATDVALGPDGSVWAIGRNPSSEPGGNQIFKWNGSYFAPVNGAADEIAVGPSDTPWIVNSENNIFFGTTGPVSVQRISGPDAIGTAIAVSQAEFPTADSAKALVLARSNFFSDGLAGGPLAAHVGGPLLVTEGADQSPTLDPRVLQEIKRVLPPGGRVYVLGGPLALSPSIDTTLQAAGFSTTRLAGADMYGTAVAIAEQLGNPSTVFEVTGLDFYDALSTVPAAIQQDGAILLTKGDVQAPETAAYLASHSSDTRYAIGGPLAAGGADPTAIDVAGPDLWGTSAAVAARFFPSPSQFGAATAATFTDGLSGGPMMGLADAPMLLVEPSGPLPTAIGNYFDAAGAFMASGTLFGGPVAVANEVLYELEDAA
jgi:hypothetical protein